MHGIRTPGGPKTSWVQSAFFKVWALASLCAVALLLGACHIETQNLEMMKVSDFQSLDSFDSVRPFGARRADGQSYLFIVGSALSCV